MHSHCFQRRLGKKWRSAGHALEEQTAQRINLGARIVAFAGQLIGAHIRRSADRFLGGVAIARVAVELSQTKIDQTDLEALVLLDEEDIAWFDVAVKSAVAMSVSQGVAELLGDMQRCFPR